MPEPDVIEDVAHLPEECAGCPHFGTCPKVATSSARNEIDVEILGSVKKHGINVLSAVKDAFLGNAYGVLFPAPTE